MTTTKLISCLFVVLSNYFFVTSEANPVLMKDELKQQLSVATNEIDNGSEIDPNVALTGVYTECLARLSFACVQQKTLIFIDTLSRMDHIPLIGNILSVEKLKNVDERTPLTQDVLTARHITDETTLRTLIDLSIDRFFQTHVIRLKIPQLFQDNADTAAEGKSSAVNSIDFSIGETIQADEGRKKGGKMKGMKKMMMMMGMMMMTKMMMLAPILMGVVGLAAIKALIFSVASITISKIMILKKLKSMMGNSLKGGGHDSGGGGGWSSGSGGGGSGGGGWDRRSLGGNDEGHYLAYKAYYAA